MATVVFYEKPGCANNTRQKHWLSSSGHALIVRDLLQTRWTTTELRRFFGQRPVVEWFNRAAPRIKSGEVRPEVLDEATALRLLVEDPLLIRRPLLEVGDRREVGFDVELIAAWLGLRQDLQDGQPDSESCRRPHNCADPAHRSEPETGQ